MSQCTSTTAKGAQCIKPTMPGINFCNVHNPDRVPYERLGKIKNSLSVADIIKMQSRILKTLAKKSKQEGLSGRELQSFSAVSNSLLKAQKEQLQVDRLDKIEKMLVSQAK